MDKLKIIGRVLELVEKHGVTAYEIAQNTDLTEAGVGKILQGKSKNPREKSLKEILNYLESYGKVSETHTKGQYKNISTDESFKKLDNMPIEDIISYMVYNEDKLQESITYVMFIERAHGNLYLNEKQKAIENYKRKSL